MSNSNYDNWIWESNMSSYDPKLIKYCGEDLHEAYSAGKRYIDNNDFEIARLRQDNGALRELIKANKRVEENSQQIRAEDREPTEEGQGPL